MFKPGDIVKFGTRGQVTYTVEVIGIDDTVMIRKNGSASARLQSGIKTSRLVIAFPQEHALDQARKIEDTEAGEVAEVMFSAPVRKLEDSIAAVKAEQSEETRRQDAVIASLTRIGKAQAEIEVPTPVEITREQARHQRFVASLTKGTAVVEPLGEGQNERVRAPKGAQATKYGQAMREALARKNRRHVHA